SRFEHVLLGAHMAMCRDCRRFAEDVEWQTHAIRNAGLMPLTYPVSLPARHSWRWPALGISTAAVAASLAALAIGLHGPSQTPRPTPAPRPIQRSDTLGVQNLSTIPSSGDSVGFLRGFRG